MAKKKGAGTASGPPTVAGLSLCRVVSRAGGKKKKGKKGAGKKKASGSSAAGGEPKLTQMERFIQFR
jgi:hypothetical protein